MHQNQQHKSTVFNPQQNEEESMSIFPPDGKSLKRKLNTPQGISLAKKIRQTEVKPANDKPDPRLPQLVTQLQNKADLQATKDNLNKRLSQITKAMENHNLSKNTKLRGNLQNALKLAEKIL